MGQFVLQFSPVDFDETVFDMPRLSAIRGASLSYLYAPKLVKRVLKQQPDIKVEPIFTGGSEGAWLISGEKSDVAAAGKAVRDALKRDDFTAGSSENTGTHSHLSYVVSTVQVEGTADNTGKVKAFAVAEACNEIKTLQGESFPLPRLNQEFAGFDPKGDRTRPADTLVDWPGEKDKIMISAAHAARREFGRDQRQNFYGNCDGRKADLDFVDDFDGMVLDGPKTWTKSDVKIPVSLSNKTAIFYVDANSLGKHRNKAMRENGLDGLQAFSDTWGQLLKQLLGKIIDWLNEGAKNHPEHFVFGETRKFHTPGNYFRFETLMWGGDEMLFVMPSWLAMEFAQNFFEWTGDWKVRGQKVTFSAGLVIANRKTPIRQTKSVAKKLAQLSKDEASGNRLQIEIFESISLPDKDFENYRNKLYFPDKETWEIGEEETAEVNRALALPGDQIGDLFTRLRKIKSDDGLPKSQLYALIREAAKLGFVTTRTEAGDKQVFDLFEKWQKRAGRDNEIAKNQLDLLRFGKDEAPPSLVLSLAMIAMLWDYVSPGEDA